MSPYIFSNNKLSHDTLLSDLIIGRHLIPLFPKTPYILQMIVMSHDDLVHNLTIGQHLIPLFPKTPYRLQLLTFVLLQFYTGY